MKKIQTEITQIGKELRKNQFLQTMERMKRLKEISYPLIKGNEVKKNSVVSPKAIFKILQK